MARVPTNATSLEYTIESALATLPGSPKWKLLEPNGINTFGATISTVAREPISKNRQRRKGIITDLDSAVDFDHDIDQEVFRDFAEGFVFAGFSTVPFHVSSQSHGLAASGTAYTLSTALGAAPAQNALVYARGFTNAANNGLKVVGAGSTTTNVVVSGNVSETPSAAQNAQLSIAGVQGASGDIQVDSNGDIISTTLDFTTLGLTVGQMIHVGGFVSGTNFATAADKGYARVKVIAANKLTLDKRPNAFTVDNGSGKTIQLLFGQFLKNVPVDDANFIERSFQFELAFPDLATGPADAYEYAKGNYCNEMTFELPLTDKATLGLGFIGTDTEVPTTSRKTGANAPANPVATAAFGTSSDIAKLRIQLVDETGITTLFKSLTMTIGNNVTPEKGLGTLGAAFLNYGNFTVDIEAQLLFTSPDVVNAIRNNTTVTMDFVLDNGDGAIAVDIPSLNLGGGDKEFPVNESVLINLSGEAFADATLGTSIGISLFPTVPLS